MSISQYVKGTSGALYNFEDITSHGTPLKEDWEYEDLTERIFSVQGEQQVLDKPHGRWFRVQADFFGYETLAELEAALNTVDSYINRLRGRLGISSRNYDNCIFKGYVRGTTPQYIGGSTPGWALLGGWLVWRQLKP